MITLQPDIEERRIILCHQLIGNALRRPEKRTAMRRVVLAGTIGASGATDLEDGDDTQDQGESPNIEPYQCVGRSAPEFNAIMFYCDRNQCVARHTHAGTMRKQAIAAFIPERRIRINKI
jgi:hypothetical protein